MPRNSRHALDLLQVIKAKNGSVEEYLRRAATLMIASKGNIGTLVLDPQRVGEVGPVRVHIQWGVGRSEYVEPKTVIALADEIILTGNERELRSAWYFELEVDRLIEYLQLSSRDILAARALTD